MAFFAFLVPRIRASARARPRPSRIGGAGRGGGRSVAQRLRPKVTGRSPYNAIRPQPGSREIALPRLAVAVGLGLLAVFLIAEALQDWQQPNSKPKPSPDDPPQDLGLSEQQQIGAGVFLLVYESFRQSQYGDPGTLEDPPDYPAFQAGSIVYGSDGAGARGRVGVGSRYDTDNPVVPTGDAPVETLRRGFDLVVRTGSGETVPLFLGSTESRSVSPDPGGPTGNLFYRSFKRTEFSRWLGTAEGAPAPQPGGSRGLKSSGLQAPAVPAEIAGGLPLRVPQLPGGAQPVRQPGEEGLSTLPAALPPKTPPLVAAPPLTVPKPVPGSSVVPAQGPLPTPRPNPEETPSDQHLTPVGPVGGSGQAPPPSLDGIAKEVGRIEKKLVQMQAAQPDTSALLDLLDELLGQIPGLIRDALQGLLDDRPGGSYSLTPPCGDRDENGETPAELVEWGPSPDPIADVAARVDALAALLQVHKNQRQPICRGGRAEGTPVTVRFEEQL